MKALRNFISIFIISIMFLNVIYGQSVGINDDGSTPDNSAILDLKSVDHGILVPRMTLAQRDAISNPANGLMVFVTDATPEGFFYYDGTTWLPVGENSNQLTDADNDTRVEVEQNPDEDKIRFTANGEELFSIEDGNTRMRGNFVVYDKRMPDSISNHMFIAPDVNSGMYLHGVHDGTGSDGSVDFTVGTAIMSTFINNDNALATIDDKNNTLMSFTVSVQKDRTSGWNGYEPLDIADSIRLFKFSQWHGSGNSQELLAIWRNRSIHNNKFGIGTTNTDSLVKAMLHVVQTSSEDAFRVDDEENDTTSFVIDSIGNVGIGVEAPSKLLHLQNNINGDTVGLQFTSFTSGGSEFPGFIDVNPNSNSMIFGVNSLAGHRKFAISGTCCNVGIGTNQPTTSIEIMQDNGISPEVYLNARANVYTDNRSSILTLAGAARNAGISFGRIDFQQYDHNGTRTDFDGASIRALKEGNDDVALRFLTAQNTSLTTHMTIHADGNIDIGNPTTVTEKLQVEGNIAPGTDNTYDLGTSSLRWDDVYATNGTIQTSDKRLKTNIRKLDYGLDQIMKIEPVRFNWKDGKSTNDKVGFIAQDIQKIFPELVNVGDDPKQTLGLNYAEMVVILTSGIQELKKENDLLKTRLLRLEHLIENP
ncbi:MAG: tail fiber domain-containing protein [Flavobacteriales bacterium]|nr:tail fiber domain-containing protein [Flavobacteriales bacterium]